MALAFRLASLGGWIALEVVYCFVITLQLSTVLLFLTIFFTFPSSHGTHELIARVEISVWFCMGANLSRPAVN